MTVNFTPPVVEVASPGFRYVKEEGLNREAVYNWHLWCRWINPTDQAD